MDGDGPAQGTDERGPVLPAGNTGHGPGESRGAGSLSTDEGGVSAQHARTSGRPHALGVTAGPLRAPSPSVRAVPGVLAAAADSGADVTLVCLDAMSARLLTTIEVVTPELPEQLVHGAVPVPAACGDALPVLSLWPLTSVTSSDEAVRRHDWAVAGSSSRGTEGWRARVEAAAYSAHRGLEVTLAVCGSSLSAGRSTALMLSAETDVPVLVLLDDDVLLDAPTLALLDACTEAWVRDAAHGMAWAGAAPEAADRIRVVDWSDADAFAPQIARLLGATQPDAGDAAAVDGGAR